MSKSHWKVSLRMDGQDDFWMLVQADDVACDINGYSCNADGVIIKFNDPIESIVRLEAE